ncbi:ORF6N domain-containing protein [Pedobacter sp. MC2016-15]|uniref:ORF6N domain-containing protein n=1 Tax=Pedobacter sp. MC2016-15 TaxID=2994473 RepID=UPI0022452CAB|nr:ORF6N domain-containing protein [Pedobacter sp. MC2016-15]MCX2477471.1 ORF6N domain-containing protein [Pedobacter sp. MC2016-15]
MEDQTQQTEISDEMILDQIYYVRGQKVMLDSDLAALYEVDTKQLKRQVRRNIERFPEDFMFELSPEEIKFLRCQIGTLKQGEHSKYTSMVFTEQGVAMLSSVLNSSKAIKVNIQIIRIFTRMREMLKDTTELRLEIERIKSDLNHHGKNMEIVFRYLDELLVKQENPSPPRKRIGFKPDF